MTLAFVADGSIEQYPIGVVEVRRRFPQTSFPANIENGDFTEFGVVTVHNVAQPSIDVQTEKLEEGTPAFNGTQWQQVWNVVPLSAEEQQRIADNKAERVRAERNKRLTDSDWTQTPDAPVDAAAWISYRAELRAVPEQPGFPNDVNWPVEPTT